MTDSTLHADTASDAVSVVDGGTVGDYIALLKPRVMSLVIFTAFVGYVLAPGALHPVLGAIAILAVAVGAGASGAINMWYDRDIDAVMARTKGRPIPAGRVNADEALAFGVVLSIGSVVVMGLAVNWLAAGLLALTIGYYVFLHHVAKAPNPAEYCRGRCRRRLSADDWLGRRDRRGLDRIIGSIRHNLHVDAAAFLGLGALPERRLPRRRRAHAASSRRSRRNPPPDRHLQCALGAPRRGTLVARFRGAAFR